MSLRVLLKDRDFRFLFAGQSLSMFGDMAMLVVLGIWAKSLTGSNGVAGSVYAAFAAPSLLMFLAGPLIDRIKRRTLMIATDLAMALAVLSLLLVHGREELWIIYGVALAYGVSMVTFSGARAGLLIVALPDKVLGSANGILTTVNQSFRLLAPLIGAGIYVAWGGGVVAIIDSATFILSAASIWMMRVREEKPQRTTSNYLEDALVGTRHLVSQRILRSGVVATVLCMFSLGLSEAVFFAVVDAGLNKPVEYVALLGSMQGLGAITAGLLLTVSIRRTGEMRPIAVGLALGGIGSILTMSSAMALVLAGAVLFGAGLPIIMICGTTLIQRRTLPELQGRVFSAYELFAGGPQLLAILIGSVAVTLLPYRVTLGVMAAGLICAATYAFITLRPSVDTLSPDAPAVLR